MGAIGAGLISLITYWTQHDPRMMHDSFASGYCYFSATFTALICGLLSALQINDYLYPETELS
jgi:hypothetical protein